jgi:hypothetical protein
VEKRKKRSDAEGGGWADPANRGKIMGGRRADADANSEGGRGQMSEVIVLEKMLDHMPDLEAEISAGLGQEIGEECGDKVGHCLNKLLAMQQLNSSIVRPCGTPLHRSSKAFGIHKIYRSSLGSTGMLICYHRYTLLYIARTNQTSKGRNRVGGQNIQRQCYCASVFRRGTIRSGTL